MRIGIYAHAPAFNGGVFRYAMTFLEMLRALELDDEFVVLHRRGTDVPERTMAGGRWSGAMLPTRPMDVVRDVALAVVGEQAARLVWFCGSWLPSQRGGRPPVR